MSFRSGRHKVAPASQGPVACTHIYRVKRRTLNSWGLSLTNVIVLHTGWSVNHYRSAFLKAYAPLTFPCRFSLAAFLISGWVPAAIAVLHACSVSQSLASRTGGQKDRLHCMQSCTQQMNKAVAVRMPRQTWHNGMACLQPVSLPWRWTDAEAYRDLASLWEGEKIIPITSLAGAVC